MGPMRLHLLDNSGEFVEEFLISIQGEQVVLSEQEAEAVSLGPAQAMTRWRGHGGDGVLDVNHWAQFTWGKPNVPGKKKHTHSSKESGI